MRDGDSFEIFELRGGERIAFLPLRLRSIYLFHIGISSGWGDSHNPPKPSLTLIGLTKVGGAQLL